MPGPKITSRNISTFFIAIGVTIVGLLLVPMSLLVAGFTLWGIGEINYPPPFIQDPLEWASNVFSITMPVAIIVVIVAVWIAYRRGDQKRTKVWAILGSMWGLMWLPGAYGIVGYL